MASSLWTVVLFALFAHSVESQGGRPCGVPLLKPNIELESKHNGTLSFPEGAEVRFKCAAGFMSKSGTRTSTCTNGQWSQLQLKCTKKTCGSAGVLVYGQYHQEGNSYGDKAYAMCNEGYSLQKDIVRQCDLKGWSSPAPVCTKRPSAANNKKCSKPREQNATLHGIKNTYYPDEILYYTCKDGFRLTAPKNHLVCKAGVWRPDTPKCKWIICRVPNITNGKVVCFKRTLNFNATITCKPGYILNGANVVTCGKNSSWEPALPSCDPESPVEVSCLPPNVPNSKGDFGNQISYRVGQSVDIVCQDNSVMIGPSKVTCQSNGHWDNLPKCSPSDKCSDPPHPANAHPIEPHRSYYESEDSVHFRCNPGYHLTSGTATILCINGLWTLSDLKCEKSPLEVTCPPPNVPNSKGQVGDQMPYRVGQSVNIVCEHNALLIGSSEVTCQSDGRWHSLPKCIVPERCWHPPHPANAHPVEQHRAPYESGEFVHFRCNHGYHLASGTSSIQCVGGQWIQTDMRCEKSPEEVTCPPPDIPNSKDQVGSPMSYRVGESITVVCQDNAVMNGLSEITCQSNGQWQNLPECRLVLRSCSPPSLPAHAQIRGEPREQYMSGDSVHFKCSYGYRLDSGSSSMHCNDGQWSHSNMRCTKKHCGSAGEVINGHYQYTGAFFGDMATAQCNEGYFLVNSGTRYCKGTGWDGRPAICEAVQCTRPPVTNAELFSNEDTFTYLQSVLYRCRSGMLMGARNIYCTKDGKWSDDPPHCQDIPTCPRPIVQNGNIVSGFRTRFEMGHMVTIMCRPTTQLVGQERITCGINGTWEPSIPRCVLRGYPHRRS